MYAFLATARGRVAEGTRDENVMSPLGGASPQYSSVRKNQTLSGPTADVSSL